MPERAPRWRRPSVMPSRRCHICRAWVVSWATAPSADVEGKRGDAGPAPCACEPAVELHQRQVNHHRPCRYRSAHSSPRAAPALVPYHALGSGCLTLTQHQTLPHHILQEPLQLLAVVRRAAARCLHHQVIGGLQGGRRGTPKDSSAKERLLCNKVICFHHTSRPTWQVTWQVQALRQAAAHATATPANPAAAHAPGRRAAGPWPPAGGAA